MVSVKRVIVAAAAVVLLSATFARAGGGILVSAKGVKQGQFKGEGSRGKQPDKIEAVGFVFEVSSPRDAASGMATGKRQYKPLQITKSIGASSPQFFQALTTNEPLQTVTLEFLGTNANGEELVYYTIKLTDAKVTSIRQYTPNDAAGAAAGKQGAQPPQVEEISLTFQKIEIQHSEGKTTAMDDWQAK